MCILLDFIGATGHLPGQNHLRMFTSFNGNTNDDQLTEMAQVVIKNQSQYTIVLHYYIVHIVGNMDYYYYYT